MTQQLMHTEVNCETGEVTVRPLTADELAYLETTAQQRAEAMEAETNAREAKEAARVAAVAKLQALGLTAEEIAALS